MKPWEYGTLFWINRTIVWKLHVISILFSGLSTIIVSHLSSTSARTRKHYYATPRIYHGILHWILAHSGALWPLFPDRSIFAPTTSQSEFGVCLGVGHARTPKRPRFTCLSAFLLFPYLSLSTPLSLSIHPFLSTLFFLFVSLFFSIPLYHSSWVSFLFCILQSIEKLSTKIKKKWKRRRGNE